MNTEKYNMPKHILESNRIFIITGIMASGKSTVAQLLAERLQKAVHVHGDIYRKMIVAGREEMSPNPSDEALRQLNLRYKLAASTADAYFEAGFNVVVQDNIIGKMLENFVGMVRNRPLYVVALCPHPEVVAEREASRNKKGYGGWTVAEFDNLFRNETPRIGLWLDSSELTPQETVDAILTRAYTEARID
ncbi:Predicted kinase [Clostridium amylolyticum]|uniref:Predicted kinase n=2 Tax=Clostridium amylolyticum TaxID=1121298 RepID=A0A1M6H566_9CLOT|nr:Predicted kinase [Clostridium amylolyticum]